jgi:hypothetical protein
MTQETLTTYAGYGELDGYNSVHFYSENQKRGTAKFTKTDCVDAWNKDYQKIEEEMIVRMRQHLSEDQVFYLVVPPTDAERKQIYLDPLIKAIKNCFPKLISLEGCLYKKDKSTSASQHSRTNRQEIIDNTLMDDQCIMQNKVFEQIPVVILDDVIATQATLEAVEQLLVSLSGKFYAFALLRTKSISSEIQKLAMEKRAS